MKRASYKEAIEWLAYNDDTQWLTEENRILSVTCCLVADLFDVPREKTADDLEKFMRKVGLLLNP